MLFNSLQFLAFFPLVTALYFLAPQRARWLLLLAASCIFYAAFIPKYLFILAFLILVDYAAGRWIERAEGRRRRALLALSIAANLSILGFFKYINFVDANLDALFAALGLAWAIPHLDIILPIGLSFHTFQSMSYTIEVYRGRVPAERHLGIYALYVMFYPQLVAGPIERP
ncbi:MAG TPA: MBOAT family protein, partial [Gemmatimonadaceae bacterium]|nr:MBOAT family protein [Gemmatimonadaceae bacterium]